MKKIGVFFMAVSSLLLVTGCGSEKTLTCTNQEEASGVKMDQEVVMKFKSDKINYVKMTVDSKAESDTLKENWSVFANALDEQYKEKKEDGLVVSTKNDSANHTYQVSIEIDLTKAREDSLKEYNLDSIAGAKDGLSDVKKQAEKSGFTCKEQ